MKKQNSPIYDAIELLREVRAKVQGNLEDSVVHQLDEVILQLEETSRKQQDRIAKQEALKLLGEGIKWLPAVAKLIEVIRDLL